MGGAADNDALPRGQSEDKRPDLRADVVIVGAGLAGLCAARRLVAGGARVIVLEAAEIPADGASFRRPGLFSLGLSEAPWRTRDALGAAGLAEIVALGRRSRAIFEELSVFTATGGLRVATDPREAGEHARTLEAWQEVGVSASLWGEHPLGPAVSVPEEGCVDLPALRAALLNALPEEALILGSPVRAVEESAGGVQILADGARVDAELAILCAGPGLRALHGLFAEAITPFRDVALRSDGPPPVVPGRAGQGWTGFLGEGAGRVVWGARWASATLEAGEDDPATWHPAVVDKLRAFDRRLGGGEIVGSPSAFIHAGTCDGLPAVGALPGRVRTLVCGGFDVMDLSLAPALADALAAGILGDAPPVWACLHPARWVVA